MRSDVSWLFGGRLGAFVLTFSIPLVLARILSAEEYGVYKQFFLVQGTVLSVLTLGFPAALFYFLPNRPGRQAAYIGNTVKIMLATSAMGAIALVIFTDELAALLGSPRLGECSVYLAAYVLLYGPGSILESVMIARRAVRLAAATGVGLDALRAALMIGAGLLAGGIGGIFVATVVWACGRLLVLALYLSRHDDLGPSWRGVARPELAEQWRYAWPFALAIVVSTAADSVHQYAVSSVFGPAGFAIYAIAYTQIPLVGIAVASAVDVALVRTTELVHQARPAEAAEVVSRTVANLSVALLPVYAWLTLNADDFIRVLYTEKFAAGVPLFRVFLVGIPLTVLGLDYVPRAFGQTGFVFRVNVGKLCVGAGLLALLLPLYGMLGAAVATVIALAVTKLAVALRVRRLLQVGLADVLPWRRVGLVATAAALACAVGTQTATVVETPLVRLALSLAISAVTYAMVAAALGLLPATLRLRALAPFGGRLSRGTAR